MEEFLIQVLIIAILLLYPLWRIFDRAGLHPALSFTIFIPYIGIFVCGIILAVSNWKLNSKIEGEG